jgi:hypothetical protein
MLSPCNGLVAKQMDHPAFQHRIDPESGRYISDLKTKGKHVWRRAGRFLRQINSWEKQYVRLRFHSLILIWPSLPSGNNLTKQVCRIIMRHSNMSGFVLPFQKSRRPSIIIVI